MWTDSHCHLTDSYFFDSLEKTLKACGQAGINRFIVPAVAADLFDQHIAICNKYQLHYSLGVHPWHIDATTIATLPALLASYIEDSSPIAIGEIGLDLVKAIDLDMQLQVFSIQMDIANYYQLPVIIHNVKASERIMQFLKNSNIKVRGVIHGFSGSLEQAKFFVDIGFKIGIGALAINCGKNQLRLIEGLHIDSIVLETDAPFCVKTNQSPFLLLDIASAVSNIKNISIKSLAVATEKNIDDIFF